MSKSKIYPVNAVPNLNVLAAIMACEIGSFPAIYLGLPLGADYKAEEVWNGVIEKVEKRLGNWHMQYLSWRSFLWQGNSEEYKFHQVKWRKVLLPKEQVGLGIRNLSKHNKSLLLKWWWRFSQGPDNWCTTKMRAPRGVGPWKHINNLKDDFFQDMSFRVGNGTNVKFRKDRWLPSLPLKESHLRLFLIAPEPDSIVARNRDGYIWDLHFRRNLLDWELGELFHLYNLLEGFSIKPQSLKWNSSSKGVYSVKAIKCFLWTAPQNGTLTHDNLKKKGLQIANRCFMCHLKEETVNHLFLHCPVVATFGRCSFWHQLIHLENLAMIPDCIFWCIWIERNDRCFDGTSTLNFSLKSKSLMNIFSWSNYSPVNDVIFLVDFISSLSLA
ncbi:unnamed protein product [Withania somnifera]